MNDLTGIRFGAEIAGAARAHHLDPVLLAALAAQETGGPGSDSGRNITGDGGHGHGLFQIDDRYHAFARSPAAADPARNAEYAAGMLQGLLERYGGDERRALSAYNAGSPSAPGTQTTWGDGRRLGYADSVLRHYAGIAGRAETSSRDSTADRTGAELGESLLAARADDAASVHGLSGAYERLRIPQWPPAPDRSPALAGTADEASGRGGPARASDGFIAAADRRMEALAEFLEDGSAA
jgi:hypothetical protein